MPRVSSCVSFCCSFFVFFCFFVVSFAARADDFDPAFDGGDGAVVPVVPVLAELGASDVVVLSGEELIARGYRTLGEALAFEAGFVRARGAGGQHYSLYGIDDGVALVVDGVPVVVDGERDVVDVDDVLDLQEVERVEIVKGPSTALSGPGALIGTVRVTSKRPGVTGAQVRTSASALTSTSTQPLPVAGERAIAANAAVRDGDLAARLSLRLNAGAEQLWRLRAIPLRFERVAGTVLAVRKADVDVVSGDDSTVNVRAAVARGEGLVDVAYAQDLEQQPLSDFSHGLLDTAQTLQRSLLHARALWSGTLGPFHVDSALTGAHHERALRIPLFPRTGLFDDGGLLAVDSAADSAAAMVRADAAVADGHHLLLALFGDVTHATARSTSTDPITGDETDDLVTFDDVSGSANGAVEYQGDFGAGVHATAGVVAFWRTGFQPGLSPRLALAWRGDGGFDVAARYGEGVRAPDRFDVTALAKAVVDGRVVGAAGNAALRPELVRTLQLGAGWAPSSALHLSARVFGLRHEDAVVAAQDGALLRPENLPPRLLAGAELGGDVAPFGDVVHVSGGVTGVHVFDEDDDVFQAVAAADVAPVKGVVGGVRARAVLKDPKDAAVVDVYGSVAVVDDVVLVVVLKNAFDALELSLDDDAPPFAEPVGYPGAGRTVVVSLEARF